MALYYLALFDPSYTDRVCGRDARGVVTEKFALFSDRPQAAASTTRSALRPTTRRALRSLWLRFARRPPTQSTAHNVRCRLHLYWRRRRYSRSATLAQISISAASSEHRRLKLRWQRARCSPYKQKASFANVQKQKLFMIGVRRSLPLYKHISILRKWRRKAAGAKNRSGGGGGDLCRFKRVQTRQNETRKRHQAKKMLFVR